jgi:2-polyprenyl-6-hydroxyphenyl methylase/3-demethylubiquinone-9 3-methyltransferase
VFLPRFWGMKVFMIQKNKVSSASQEEVDHFSGLAAEWWNPVGDFESLHHINPLRMTYVRDQICHHFNRDIDNIKSLTGLSVLDVGCGGGLICEPLVRLGAAVTGIDAAPESIEAAKNHASHVGLNIDYQNTLPEEIIGQDRQFDVLINMEVIEHVSDVDLFIGACEGLLKPGGIMVGATISRTIKSLVLAKIAAEYILRWVPAGTHDWQKFLKPSEFSRYLRSYGLIVSDLSGMRLNLTNGHWCFSENLDVNYFISAKKPE